MIEGSTTEESGQVSRASPTRRPSRSSCPGLEGSQATPRYRKMLEGITLADLLEAAQAQGTEQMYHI